MKGANALRRILQLRAVDYLDVARAVSCLLRVWVSLRADPLPGTLARLGLQQILPEATPEEILRSQQVTRWAHHLFPVQPNCLLDALAAALWLRLRSVSAPLVIGVRQTAGEVEAHAWLEGSEGANDDFRILWRSHGASQ